LLVVAQKSGRFDAAVAAYISRVMSEPPANVPRPQLPDAQSSYLDTAAADVNTALQNPKLNDEQRVALLSFLVDLQRARKDTRAADVVAQRLDEVLAKDPNNPQAGRAIARRKLQAAQSAFDQKDYKQAITEIEGAKAQFTDLSQQADALYLLAEAKFALASGTKEPAALQDCALAFMRVVAHFKDQPDRPHVAQAMVRTGQILEQANDPAGARAIYNQLVQQYPDDPNVPAARAALERLKQSATSAPTK
jgi:TolA-binding protein